MCCAGTIWITQEGDPRDIFLAAGERFTFDRPSLALISAEEGARNEWMDDVGFAVICLPALLVRCDFLSNGRKEPDPWKFLFIR